MADERHPPEDAVPHDDPFVRLNALVDGELPATEQARLAAEMAQDRDLARAHATLACLKATIATMGDGDGAAVPVPQRRVRRLVAAAAIAALAAGGAISAWIFAAPPFSVAQPSHTIVRVSLLPADPLVPDLTIAGLRLSGIEVGTDPESPAVTATYLGPRGCRLTLRVGESRTPEPLDASARRSWTAGGLIYELTAFGMPAARFAAVAGTAEQAVRGQNLDRDSMRLARASNAPCVG